MLESELIPWVCDGCKEPVGQASAFLYVNLVEIRQYKHDLGEWDKNWEIAVAHRSPGELGPMELYLSRPPMPSWHLYHLACDPDPKSTEGHYIPIEDVLTYKQMLGVTATLMSEKWFMGTDWDAIIRRAIS